MVCCNHTVYLIHSTDTFYVHMLHAIRLTSYLQQTDVATCGNSDIVVLFCDMFNHIANLTVSLFSKSTSVCFYVNLDYF